MRLLLPGRKEGIARYAYETSKRIVRNNPHHKFFFIFDRAHDKELIFAENITPIVVGPQARHPWLWYWWFEQSLPRIFKMHKIDLFYSPEMYISLKANIPTLMVSHDIVFETFPDHFPKHQLKYLLRNVPKFHSSADHIVAVSNFGKQDIVKHYNIPADKISVAGNSCPDGFAPVTADQKLAIQKKYSNSAPYIMYVGALHPRKNVVRMLQAFQKYKESSKSDLKFIIVGRMAWKSNEIQTEIENAKDVIWLNQIENELKDIMASSEALFFASLFEGFGIPLLEGMQSGVPVITSNANAMKEVAGDAAILVDPYSIEEMAQAIQEVTTNTSLRQTIIEKGKLRVTQFSWDKTAKHLEEKLIALKG